MPPENMRVAQARCAGIYRELVAEVDGRPVEHGAFRHQRQETQQAKADGGACRPGEVRAGEALVDLRRQQERADRRR